MESSVQKSNSKSPAHGPALTEPAPVRWLLTVIAIIFLLLFLVVPLAVVFTEAFQNGVSAYMASLVDPDALSAIVLTLKVAVISVVMNIFFGLAAAWAICKFHFRGKGFLITLIDLPFAVSPVVAGLLFVLMFGLHGWFGSWLSDHNLKIIFAVPGIVLATLFVTFPFVARELIPVMQAQGNDEEEAALVLGASGLQTFIRVTLPNISWGLLYGLILCNARAMGEFGAVSVVSGHQRGLTVTLPLQVEILYGEFKFQAAFAVASLLSLVAVLTLIIKSIVEWRTARREHATGKEGIIE